MTPDLMDEGARRVDARREKVLRGKTRAGGRQAGFGRPTVAGGRVHRPWPGRGHGIPGRAPARCHLTTEL